MPKIPHHPTLIDPSALILREREIMGVPQATVSLLDKFLDRESRRCPVTLYRGLDRAELTETGDAFETASYTLMTERPRVALGHAELTQTDTVLMVDKAVALCYWEFLETHRDAFVRAGAPEDRVDARIARSRAEREWVIAPYTGFRVLGNAPGSGMFAQMTVMRAKPADDSNTVQELLDGRVRSELAGRRKPLAFQAEAKIRRELAAATAASEPTPAHVVTGAWFKGLSPIERAAYLRRHPGSKYANLGGTDTHAKFSQHHVGVAHPDVADMHRELDRHGFRMAGKASNDKGSSHRYERHGLAGTGHAIHVNSNGAWSHHRLSMGENDDYYNSTPSGARGNGVKSLRQVLFHRELKNAETAASEPFSVGSDADGNLRRTVIRTTPHEGWIERLENWSMHDDPSTPPVPISAGYTPDGAYIGSAEDARHIVETRGIAPELIDGSRSVCSVGFHPGTKKWYGWSHRAISGFPTRKEAVQFAQEVSSEDIMNPKAEVAADVDRESVFLTGNVMRKYDDMMMRMKTAALCSQPRVTQRLHRQINVLRMALGMQPIPEVFSRNSGRAFDQHVVEVEAQDPWNRDWMKQCTASCIDRFTSAMSDRGFAISRSTLDNGVTRWTATGAEAGRGPATYEIDVLGGTWCTAARRNGQDLGLFDTAASEEDCALKSIASENWDGSINGRQAQAYARSWARLIGGKA